MKNNLNNVISLDQTQVGILKPRSHYRNFFCNKLKLLKQVKNLELHRRSGDLATDNLSLGKPACYWYDAAWSRRNFCSVSSLLFGLVTAENCFRRRLFRQCFKIFVSRQSARKTSVRQWRTDGPSVSTDGLPTTDYNYYYYYYYCYCYFYFYFYFYFYYYYYYYYYYFYFYFYYYYYY